MWPEEEAETGKDWRREERKEPEEWAWTEEMADSAEILVEKEGSVEKTEPKAEWTKWVWSRESEEVAKPGKPG